MDVLRRLFGGAPAPEGDDATADEDDAGPASGRPSYEEGDAEERARELELLRAEQERLDDLVLRQQRYADRSWVPPAQGGPRRSDDGEAGQGDDR